MWQNNDITKVFKRIQQLQPEMIRLQAGLTAIPALSPISKGIGEVKKAEYLKKALKQLGFSHIEEYRAPDKSAPCGYRPNLITRIKGRNHSKTIWLISHIDIVPPGARNLWNTDPYKTVVKDGKIFGRGTEDNQQAIVTSIFAAKAMKDLNLTPEYDVALGFLADEETGSHFGIRWLLDHKKLFRKQDIIIVPDGGREDSLEIIIAEKAILWLKFTVKGKQCHASRPDQGINAHRAGAELIGRLDNLLHNRFNVKNRLFNPPLSTFEPTMKSANVENVNTIPGEDIFYFDCRILPKYNTTIVKKTARQEAAKIEEKYKVKITIEPVNESDSSYTPESAEAIRMLSGSIQYLKGKKPALVGMGGGTFAAHFRQHGFPAVVWSTLGEMAHQPNEYCLIKNMITDTKVFAHLLIGQGKY
ncbi:MAG TPA: M20 family metallo-hydrolase [Planctomycetota bacterium]|nr:M20 family metallo-hydrolase [Planctomycetota bacterium]